MHSEPTPQELDAAESVKALEKDAIELMRQLESVPDIDPRQLAFAVANIEQGCMWALKALTRPSED